MGFVPVLVGLAVGAGACAVDDPEIPEISGPVTETAVTLHADGTTTAIRREVSIDEQVAELEARLDADDGVTARVLWDPACAATSLYVFDQINRGGNRVCFKREGDYGLPVDLRTIVYDCRTVGFPPRPSCTYWNDRIRSYWTGVDTGRFIPLDMLGTMWFLPYRIVNEAEPVVRGADVITLGPEIR